MTENETEAGLEATIALQALREEATVAELAHQRGPEDDSPRPPAHRAR